MIILLLSILIHQLMLQSYSISIHKTKLKFKSNAIVSLPNPITSDQANTWAYDTMSRRIHTDILPRIIEDNKEELTSPTSSLRSECFLLLKDLESSLQCGTSGYLRYLTDNGPDQETWNGILNTIPESSRNWLNAPWVISEFYFYRRIIEAFKYYQTGYDMFVVSKLEGLESSLPFINEVMTHLTSLLDTAHSDNNVKQTSLKVALLTSLWGNKMDLSLWPTQVINKKNDNTNNIQQAGTVSYGSGLDKIRSYILDDQTDQVVEYLETLRNEDRNIHGTREIGIIVDNAGYEVVSDLVLGYCLLELGVADEVTFHSKGHPTFVSDATTEDIINTIQYLASSSSSNIIKETASIGVATALVGKKLESYLMQGKIKIVDDLFWCQPTAFWNMPDHVQDKINNCRLVFVKGDANYRRLLGELQWPLHTKSSDILSYWPVPVCALRTFKAEIGCGISKESQLYAQQQDKNWQVSGKWGVVQLGGI